mgnify:CR=1 FL=1
MNLISFVPFLIVGVIFFFIGRSVFRMMKRKHDLNAFKEKLEAEGYNFPEDYQTPEWEEILTYDLKKEMLVYITDKQPIL